MKQIITPLILHFLASQIIDVKKIDANKGTNEGPKSEP